MRKVTLLLLLLSITPMTVHAHLSTVHVDRKEVPSFIGYVEDEVVVRFQPGSIPTSSQDILVNGKTGNQRVDTLGRRHKVASVRQMFGSVKIQDTPSPQQHLSGWYKIKFSEKRDIPSIVAEYKNLPDVVDVQPIGIHTVSLEPNDPVFSSQWHLDPLESHGINAPGAWDLQTGNQRIIVAVLDTGVRYFHKDLGGSQASYSNPEYAGGNMWINQAEQSGISGEDDDGNGYVDDWIGWDFVNNTTSCWSGEDCLEPDNDPRDFNGHGTHCAGIIGAITNNGYAAAGLAGGWGNEELEAAADGVRIMALRVGWSDSYSGQEVGYVRMDFAAEALRYAADNGARIASCSWGASDTGGISAAIDYFIESGGIIFKAAGNANTTEADDMCLRDDIICVAATDDAGCKSSFSNYGDWVDLSAPGSDILSLYHLHSDPENDYMAYMSGTSMATPLAAAAAALVWSQAPGALTSDDLLSFLYNQAEDISDLSCNADYDGLLGTGQAAPDRSLSAYIASVPAISYSMTGFIILILLILGAARLRHHRMLMR